MSADATPSVVAAAGRWLGLDVIPRWLGLLLLALVVHRVLYHVSYLAEVPFALATFSDGAIYEAAALDIREHPPLGTEPFYLQGLYAYFMATGMIVAPLGLLPQLVAAAGGLVVFHRVVLRWFGPQTAAFSSAVLLSCPALAFYENKFLGAELGVLCNIATLWAATVVRERPGPATWSLLGACAALSVLARPNMILALPFVLVAAHLLGPRELRLRKFASVFVLVGFILALAPMALRNLAVTGHPDVQPVHGGGTSFYIGNNPKARGLWNDADLVTARVGTEALELEESLELEFVDERDRERAIGRELYRRAFAFIVAEPGAWLRLECRKLWYLIGNDEITQDYDFFGERELLWFAHRVALPFAVVLGLSIVGIGWFAKDTGGIAEPHERRALAFLLCGQATAIVAANLLFFTSSQHRMPLLVPLAPLAGLAIARLSVDWRNTPRGALALGLVVLAQGFVPRLSDRSPHPVHYYNLALVQKASGDPRGALASLDRAVDLRAAEPLFRLERARLRIGAHDLDGAEDDLRVALSHELPSWAKDDVVGLALRIELERSVE